MSFVGIYSTNREEYVYIELACALYGKIYLK